ncbi:hypothetical protein ACVWZM_001562 [Bradyrhizobium sp. USDA 4501]
MNDKTQSDKSIVAYGFKDIGVTGDGNYAKVVLLAKDLKTEMPIHMAADLVDKLLPHLMNLAAESERRRNEGTNPARVFQIKQGDVGQTSEDSVMFNFKTPQGQDFRFEMDKIGAKLIWESLGVILGLIEQRSGPIDKPTRQ